MYILLFSQTVTHLYGQQLQPILLAISTLQTRLLKNAANSALTVSDNIKETNSPATLHSSSYLWFS